ncbi:MAG: 6-phosphofructokinase [Acidimicrobiia bacterium]|nr:6-phosphofructokinase [Acidimicrobiia bacterium]
MSRIGVLTGGGDCPGLNAVIRAVVGRSVEHNNIEVVGFRNGWAGILDADWVALDRDSVRGILGKGGTILGSSRRDPYVHAGGLADMQANLDAAGVDRLIVIGGDGTLKSAMRLGHEGLNVIGVPKTIDNDIAGTDMTFGFDTASQIATDAIDRITTTAEAHNRVMLVEVMGRTQGWIAIQAGIAGGADAILIPEVPYDLSEIAETVNRRTERGCNYSLVVVAEGVESPSKNEQELPVDAYGFKRLGGVAYEIAPLLEDMTGMEARVTVLGYIQRGGTPTSFDRVLATRLGASAADLAAARTTGVMAALRGTDIVAIPLEEACASTRPVDPRLYDVAKTFFG